MLYLLQEGLGVMLLPGDAEALPWEQHAVKAAGTHSARTAIGHAQRLAVTTSAIADSESQGLCWSRMFSSTGRKQQIC